MATQSTAFDFRLHEMAVASLTWERTQELAVQAARLNRIGAAERHWARALEIAERHLGRGDPRLAASLTNLAYGLRLLGREAEAKRRFDQAMSVWDDSWRWLPLMRDTSRRVEQTYDPATQRRFEHLVARARAATASMARDNAVPVGRYEQWLALRPRTMNDVRKLLGGVLLVMSRPGAAKTDAGRAA